MKRWLIAAAVATVIVAPSPSVFAQWPLHPQPGVPKGPDGKPNLSAPAPRTANGKPDFSGIWIRYDGPEPNGPATGRAPLVKDGNVGAGFKEGLPFQPWAAELQKKRAADNGLNDPDGLCLPQGPLEYHIDPQPIKIIQTPQQILYISESNYGLRTFYMDGRSLPPQGEVQPYWHGYSIGRWDGDTLVVASNNLRGGTRVASVRSMRSPIRSARSRVLESSEPFPSAKYCAVSFCLRKNGRALCKNSSLYLAGFATLKLTREITFAVALLPH